MTAPFASTGAGYDLAAIVAATEAEFLEDLPMCPKPRLRAVHRGAKRPLETQIRPHPHSNQVSCVTCALSDCCVFISVSCFSKTSLPVFQSANRSSRSKDKCTLMTRNEHLGCLTHGAPLCALLWFGTTDTALTGLTLRTIKP